MRKIYPIVLCGLFLMTVVGCGTIKGMGEDISTVGHWLTRGSDTVKNPDTVNK